MSGKGGSGSKTDPRTLTILVLGDDGVGKSSLISTFVSRHFSEAVPGIMTRVRLPPDPENHCLTTIVDSQGGDQALIGAVQSSTLGSNSSSTDSFNELLQSTLDQSSSTTKSPPVPLGGIEHVDSIVLVYALDRQETFFRMESHWLPLIERCYRGKLPVIIAGNKMDSSQMGSHAMMDEQSLARSRQQIVSLMQRFRFVRQCIKCSAKNLIRVDEIFIKAQQSVLYPFTPLYDLNTGQLTIKCQKALTRIFRMYDEDHDGLLSNAELDNFQYHTFHVPLVERDLTGWKKVVNKHNPTPEEEVVRDGKFTVPGFLAIFDVFISQNRLDVPWRVLRRFGYDDTLNLNIPGKVARGSGSGEVWKLSVSARRFLTALFHQFDSDQDGLLSPDDLTEIFKIIPDPALPPWHPVRESIFDGCFSIPRESMPTGPPIESSTSSPPLEREQQVTLPTSLSASGITLNSGGSLPTVGDMSDDSFPIAKKPMDFLEWMSHWHTMAAIAPAAARMELFRLGHVEASPKSKRRSARRKAVAPTMTAQDYDSWVVPSLEIRVLVLGAGGCGKSCLLRMLCGGDNAEGDVPPTTRPETSSSHVTLKRRTRVTNASTKEEDFVVHLIFTEVPETADYMKNLTMLVGKFDLVTFTFDSEKEASFSYCLSLEKDFLNDQVPRVFLGTKKDLISESNQVLDVAQDHCRELDLEPPLQTSANEKESKFGILEHLSRSALGDVSGIESLKSKPHEAQKRMEAARRKKMIWFGGLVGVSVAVAVGVGVLWTGMGKSSSGDVAASRRSEGRFGLGWLSTIFFGTGSSVSQEGSTE